MTDLTKALRHARQGYARAVAMAADERAAGETRRAYKRAARHERAAYRALKASLRYGDELEA